MNKFCGQCGEKLLQSSKFCGQCGIKTDNQSKPTKDNFNKKKSSIEKDIKLKSKGRNLYSIIGVLIFGLIFGSRAIYTTYRNQETYELVVPPNEYNDVVDLIIDKDWKLKSYSNLTFETSSPFREELLEKLNDNLNNLINDNNSFLKYSKLTKVEMDNLLSCYEEDWDEELGEIMGTYLLFEYTNEAEGPTLFFEDNKVISYGVNSETEDILEGDFKIKNVIVDIDKSSMKIHQYTTFASGGIEIDMDCYLAYETK